MNILVTGSNGQLGRQLRNASFDSGHHFVFTDITESTDVETLNLDICNPDAVEIVSESEKIDLIVNCAAYTDVEKAEDDIYMADLLNHTAPRYLAEAAKKRDIPLIHISTDYVFSGRNHPYPYCEKDIPEPANVYGTTKLAGEDAIMKSGCKYIIIRTSWLYSAYGKNFLKTMQSLFSSKKEVKVVCDSVGTPTWAGDLADAIMHIIENPSYLEKTGLYHYSDEGVASWYDFAHCICSLGGESCRVIPVMGVEYPTRARRPMYSVLDKSLFKKTFGVTVPHWQDSIKECLKTL